MSTVLMIVVIIFYSFQTLFCKLFTDRYPGKPALASPVFCVLEGIAIPLITWGWCGFHFEFAWETVALGLANSLVLLGYNTFLIQAGKKGSYAFMNVMMLFGGITLPSIYSILALGGSITPLQIIAIGIMLGACVLMNLKEMQLKNTHWSYYLFCFLLFLFNGLYGILLKVQAVVNESQSKEMIFLTFLGMGLVSLGQLIWQEKGKTMQALRLNGRSVWPLVICLFSAAMAVNLVMELLPLMNAPVFFTVENGGVLLLSAVYSIVLFKEKPTVPHVLGMALAIASITMLSI